MIPVLVMESECASGESAVGRLHVDVRYTPSAVSIGIEVDVLEGDQTCEGVDTPYTVELSEPLGARDLIDLKAGEP